MSLPMTREEAWTLFCEWTESESLRVADPRHVVQGHPLLGEQRAGQQRQRGVLVPGGHDGARERHAAFDHELLHKGGG